MKKQFLIASNDRSLRVSLAECLAREWRIPVIRVGTTREAAQVIFDGVNALLATILDMERSTIDLEQPGDDGIELEVLRFCSRRLPVMLLGPPRLKARLVRGLDAGAIDYMIKPLRQVELLARMRAHVSTFERALNVTIPIGPFRFLPTARMLHDTISDQQVRLTPKESDLLKLLYDAQGQAITKQMLLEAVWGYRTDIATFTVDTHISRLRRKTEHQSCVHRFIVTDGGGYRLALT